MPIYEYACAACSAHHEIMQKITDEPLTVCPGCGGELKRIISSTSFVLKGTGWYATDYASGRKKAGDKDAGPTKDSGTKTDAKAEGAPAAAKSAASA